MKTPGDDRHARVHQFIPDLANPEPSPPPSVVAPMLPPDSVRSPHCLTAAITSFAAALALLPSTAEAGGDAVWGTRGASEMTEQEHRIELEFERGYATLRVQRTIHNALAEHDEAHLAIMLPTFAVATGLRTLGEVDGKPEWFTAELLEDVRAASLYAELTGHGVHKPKDPALLSWIAQGELHLQVFPVAPSTRKTVDYTLMMPASYGGGRWMIDLPELGSASLPASLVINPRDHLDQLFVDGRVVGRGHVLTLDHDVRIELAPRDPAPIELALAAVDTGSQRELIHYRVTLAKHISEVPRRARIVVAIDLSRSREQHAVEAQRRAALAYLAHFVDPALEAEVALLGFNHEVHALSPGFVDAATAVDLLERAPLPRRNGSEIALALAEADALLAKASRGPRRIVLLSDFETASRLTPEQARSSVAHSRATLHLALVEDADLALARNDAHPWAPLAADTEGVMWTAGITASDPQTAITDNERATFEEWARPLRIDGLAVRVDGAVFDDGLEPLTVDSLAEGQGLEELFVSRRPAAKLVVDGVLWNEPIAHTTKPSRSEGDRWSALVFGSYLVDDLGDREMLTLATRGGAVSPTTSYLAVEPGVRPSTAGLEDWERGLTGIGELGDGAMGFGAAGQIGHFGGSFDPRAWLEDELTEAWRRCGGEAIAGVVELETMSAEILDVRLNAGKADAKLETCATQLIWTLELPSGFDQRERWSVVL